MSNLLIHALAQWSDPALREFNLIALDMRAHGLTLGRLNSGPIDVMEDVHHFMVSLLSTDLLYLQVE